MAQKNRTKNDVKRPHPIKPNNKTFQEKVDYVAKALIRGSWGETFDQHLQGADSEFIVAVIMRRAERNKALKNGILKSFNVERWADVPWGEISKKFHGQSSQKIASLAAEHVAQINKQLSDTFKNPEKLFD